MKTRVIIKQDDQYQCFKKGDCGYVDGYVRGRDERPYAVVILYIKNTIVLVPLEFLEAITTNL